MKKLPRVTQWQIIALHVADLKLINKNSIYKACLANGQWVRITRSNFEEIKKAWHGAKVIEESGFACSVLKKGWHEIHALQLNCSMEEYGQWQEASARQHVKTGARLNFYDWRRQVAVIALVNNSAIAPNNSQFAAFRNYGRNS